MFTLYKDKSENFECKIHIDGANLSEAQARLVLENQEYNLIFKGNIKSDGTCIIPIPKLKILSESLKGNLKLEVIVDNDTYFVPYEDIFEIEVNKKVMVEVKNSQPQKEVITESKLKVTAVLKENVEGSKTDIIISNIIKEFKENDIDIFNIKGNKRVNSIINKNILNSKLNKEQLLEIQTKLLTKLIEL